MFRFESLRYECQKAYHGGPSSLVTSICIIRFPNLESLDGALFWNSMFLLYDIFTLNKPAADSREGTLWSMTMIVQFYF